MESSKSLCKLYRELFNWGRVRSLCLCIYARFSHKILKPCADIVFFIAHTKQFQMCCQTLIFYFSWVIYYPGIEEKSSISSWWFKPAYLSFLLLKFSLKCHNVWYCCTKYNVEGTGQKEIQPTCGMISSMKKFTWAEVE